MSKSVQREQLRHSRPPEITAHYYLLAGELILGTEMGLEDILCHVIMRLCTVVMNKLTLA
jgi:hypothetical protein